MTAKKNTPPATNRGVEKQVSLSIHWIEATFKKGVEVHYDSRLSSTKTECKSFNAYNVGVRYSDGRVELHHTTRKEMGTHVITSGEVLDHFPIPPIEFLSSLVANHARITRLDLAVDVKNGNLKPERATELLKQGKAKKRTRKNPRWDDPGNPGYTQYFGKKSSEVFVRIYDKAAEMTGTGDWTRVEIVYHAERAHSAALKVLKNADFRALIRGFLDFEDWPEWSEIFTQEPISVKSEKKDTNTQLWLLRVAAASLAREIHLAGDDDFYFRFIDSVKVKLEELRDEYNSNAG